MARKILVFIYVIVGGLLGTFSLSAQNMPVEVASDIQRSVARLFVYTDHPELPERIGTGFLWLDSQHVVTAYHVVVNATSISVDFERGTPNVVSKTGTVIATLRRHDLALIRLNEPVDIPPLSTGTITDGMNVFVFGYPLSIKELYLRRLETSLVAPNVLRINLDPEARQTLSELDFPSLDTLVTPVVGPLLPGDSGAPITNAQGQVIGIGNGGLRNGNIGLGWIVPVSYLPVLLDTGPENVDEVSDLNSLAAVSNLFFDDSVPITNIVYPIRATKFVATGSATWEMSSTGIYTATLDIEHKACTGSTRLVSFMVLADAAGNILWISPSQTLTAGPDQGNFLDSCKNPKDEIFVFDQNRPPLEVLEQATEIWVIAERDADYVGLDGEQLRDLFWRWLAGNSSEISRSLIERVVP